MTLKQAVNAVMPTTAQAITNGASAVAAMSANANKHLPTMRWRMRSPSLSVRLMRVCGYSAAQAEQAACKSYRPLFELRAMLSWLRKQVTRMGGQMVIPVYAMVHAP